MKRITFTSAFLEARALDGKVAPSELQSHRGDEHLCAKCAKRPGVRFDGEARLICEECS